MKQKQTTTKLKKGALLTDIHFGKKSNSQTHNEDCINFLQWFCQQVKNDPEIDYIGFLGDWNENRSALNIATLNYSYTGAKMLNDLGLPVFFVIGNHDLYQRHTREIHSVIPFNEFSNFILIEQPLVVDSVANKVLFCPYLFHEEYPELIKFIDIPVWAGHFEFRGFEITGYGMIMPTGPDPKDFKGPKHILSGHFHKRQQIGNVVYIGNTFPMDFGDADDQDRGMAIYNHETNTLEFINWTQCPKYIKTTLTNLLDKTTKLHKNSRVKCVVDLPITFEEGASLKQAFIEKYQLREFTMEESYGIHEALTDTETTISWEGEEHKLTSVNDLVLHMLREIESDHIDNQKLIEIYTGLK